MAIKKKKKCSTLLLQPPKENISPASHLLVYRCLRRNLHKSHGVKTHLLPNLNHVVNCRTVATAAEAAAAAKHSWWKHS
jgi:hypothetical protein